MTTKTPEQMSVDSLKVFIHPDRSSMGREAGAAASAIISQAIEHQGSARVIVASAPSQDEMLASLTSAWGIDWSKVTVFHMDEYVGLPAGHPATFRAYQKTHLLAKVSPAAFHGIAGEAGDLPSECSRYTALLLEAPIDLVCMGIGENGHIAFNDPPVADFNDPQTVKVVELDEACRRQQVNDGCFPDFDAVPRQAMTLTCPALLSARHLVCVVPGPRKALAVARTLQGSISSECPASILRKHSSASLHLDTDAASLLLQPQ